MPGIKDTSAWLPGGWYWYFRPVILGNSDNLLSESAQAPSSSYNLKLILFTTAFSSRSVSLLELIPKTFFICVTSAFNSETSKFTRLEVIIPSAVILVAL